ncbi:MAG TPA: dihydropteroate synthase [Chloroflexia bacterium]
MSPAHARLLTSTPEVLAAELAGFGAASGDTPARARASSFAAVRIEGLSSAALAALAATVHAEGGELVTAEDRGEALVLGTRAQFAALGQALRAAGGVEAAQALDDLFAALDRPTPPLQLGRYPLPLGRRTLVMGILNMTPDSFSGDGLDFGVDAAVVRAQAMQAAGADILDVGGMSTRPGAEEIAESEELRRVVPLIERLAREVDVPLSVDTYRAAVADAALAAGAVIVNDITGLGAEPELAGVVTRRGAALVLMHIKGTPRTMQDDPQYADLMGEIIAYLRAGCDRAVAAGVPRDHLWIDPGIGFGKTIDHNLEILRRLGELRSLGLPVLVGTSRKGFLGRILGGRPPQERVAATGATVAVSIAHGAAIVRVHDVGPAVDVARVADAILRGRDRS